MSRSHYSIKIMNTEPHVSDEDIRQSMDFGNILQRVAEDKLHRERIVYNIKIASLVTGVLILGFLAYHAFKPTDSIEKETVAAKPAQEKMAGEKLPEEKKVATRTIDNSKKSNPVTTKPGVINIQKIPAPVENSSTTASPYTPAEPLNGFPALYKYFNDELHYPAEALPDSIQGVVAVKFVVSESGNPEQFTLLNPLHPACDKEALRVMSKMPAWKPATLDGKPVSSKITIPLTFSFKINRK